MTDEHENSVGDCHVSGPIPGFIVLKGGCFYEYNPLQRVKIFRNLRLISTFFLLVMSTENPMGFDVGVGKEMGVKPNFCSKVVLKIC